jgi:DNA-binding CsgD family transcriptional regulator
MDARDWGARGSSARKVIHKKFMVPTEEYCRLRGFIYGRHFVIGRKMAMAENPMGLSPRERQIAEFLLQGCDNAEIAKLLKMKRRTVKAYLNRLFRRFEIKDGIKRVKLATLLYRGMCIHHSAEPDVRRADRTSPLEESSTPDSTLADSKMAEWRTPAAELQKQDENADLKIQRTA